MSYVLKLWAWLVALLPKRKRGPVPGTWLWACEQRVPVGYYYGSFFMPVDPRTVDRFRQALQWETVAIGQRCQRPLVNILGRSVALQVPERSLQDAFSRLRKPKRAIT